MNRNGYSVGVDAYASPLVDPELIDLEFVDKSTPLPEPVDTIVQELAVLPFSDFDRKAFYGDFLPLKANVAATASNIKSFTRTSITYSLFLAQLEKYVDLSIIEKAFVRLYPAYKLVRSTSGFDEIITEAIHQFQLKCWNSKEFKYYDGIIGFKTLDNLGFVFQKNRIPYAPSSLIRTDLISSTKAIEKYAKAIPIPALHKANGKNWYSYRCSPVVFGRTGKFGYGFSVFLVLELRKAEQQLFHKNTAQLAALFNKNILGFNSSNDDVLALLKSAGGPPVIGQVPKLLGDVLEINEDHGDIRPTGDKPRSKHLTGLAIDIKYTANPWVTGKIAFDDIKKTSPALVPENGPTASKYFFNLAEKKNTSELYDHLHTLSQNYAAYYKAKYTKRDYPQIPYLQIGVSKYFRDPRKGFLNLNKDLVLILRDQLGLAWGAADFGPGENGDMMHFDMRTSEIGLALGDTRQILEKVHPKFRKAPIPELEDQVADKDADSWYAQLIRKMNDYAFWAIKGLPVTIQLISMFQRGERNPRKITDSLYYEVVYPEQKTPSGYPKAPSSPKDWEALYNFVVGPFLLLTGRAVNTRTGNLLLPDGGKMPLLLVKNEYGLILFPSSGPGFARYTFGGVDDVYVHPITGIRGKYGDNWIDPYAAAGFYNTIQDFRATPEGRNVVIHYGDMAAYDPSIDIGHETHKYGRAVDIHYFGSAGEELGGYTAYKLADVKKMNLFFAMAEGYGFGDNYTFGKRFTHKGGNNHAGHKNHFHLGQKGRPAAISRETDGRLEVAIEYNVPVQSAIIIKPTKFVWSGQNLPVRAAVADKYAAYVGCLPASIPVFYDIEGTVVIRSATTGDEVPYTADNHKLNFPGMHFFREVDLIPASGTPLVFLNRSQAAISPDGTFKSTRNYIMLKQAVQSMTLWLILSDPAHRRAAPQGMGSTLQLQTISTDIPSICSDVLTATNAANYYSSWYRDQAEKLSPISARAWDKPIKFDPKELDAINYYLQSAGLQLDSQGFMKQIPGWQAPDYWRWMCRAGIWNNRAVTYLRESNVRDQLNYYKHHYFIDAHRLLNFHVFIGALRSFESMHTHVRVEEQISILRRCGHERSLIFDDVLNLPVAAWQQYGNKGLGGLLQFLKDHNRILVNGREIDFWHLFVGLDALSQDKGPKDKVTLFSLPLSPYPTQMERAAAATWAGDAASALIDWMVRFDTTAEQKLKPDTQQNRLNYYWNSRFPVADLDGDILAWGLFQLRQKMPSVRLSDLLLYFFHPGLVKQHYKSSFELFVKHYSLPGKPTELDIARIEGQIHEFGDFWTKHRFWSYGRSKVYTDGDYQWGLAEVVSRLINYVDSQLM